MKNAISRCMETQFIKNTWSVTLKDLLGGTLSNFSKVSVLVLTFRVPNSNIGINWRASINFWAINGTTYQAWSCLQVHLAKSSCWHQDEPYRGRPTIQTSRVSSGALMCQTLAAPEASCDPHAFYVSRCWGVTPPSSQAPRSRWLSSPPVGRNQNSLHWGENQKTKSEKTHESR